MFDFSNRTAMVIRSTGNLSNAIVHENFNAGAQLVLLVRSPK